MKLNKTNVKRLLTRDKFRKYLASKQPDLSAGKCGNPTKCAIANYLTENLPLQQGDGVEVTTNYVYINRGVVFRVAKLQKWATRFIKAYDEGGVTAKTFGTALEILDGV